MGRLAILGGDPAFPVGLPFVRPARPPLPRVMQRLEPSYERGILTNGPLVQALEVAIAERLGVRHVVAVASCTSGLMLSLRVLQPKKPRVVLPSFTFSASAHAVAWNGLEPSFAECDPDTFQLDPDAAERQLVNAGALMPTHVFGAPCLPARFEALARDADIPLLFDAAHALGAAHRNRPIGGFGDAEIFSLTPTKPLVAGEGGLVATMHDDVAERLRWGRDYGNPGDYNTRFVGLNARMSEFHAAVALEALDGFEANLYRRRALADRYRNHVRQIPGLRAQAVSDCDTSTYKDFTVVIDEARFGLDRDAIVAGLAAEGVDTRCYFSPAIHRQDAYAELSAELPITEQLSENVVSLPIYPALAEHDLDLVAERLQHLHDQAEAVRDTTSRAPVGADPTSSS